MDSNTKDKKHLISSLIRRIRENDLFALGELMEIKQGDIRKIAFSILGDVSLCEDVVNDVLIVFIQNVYKFRTDANINGWINTVTINICIDRRRKAVREVVLPEESLAASKGASAGFEDLLVDRITTVEALEKLPELERRVLLDKVLGKLSYGQIMDKYHMTKKQARLTFDRAKKLFREAYIK